MVSHTFYQNIFWLIFLAGLPPPIVYTVQCSHVFHDPHPSSSARDQPTFFFTLVVTPLPPPSYIWKIRENLKPVAEFIDPLRELKVVTNEKGEAVGDVLTIIC